MANVGYKRVSTADQNTDRQLVGIQLDKAFEEHCSASTIDRPVWLQTLDYLREGDKLYIHSLDRVCRSGAQDAVAIVELLTQRQIAVEFVKEGLSFCSEMNAAQKGVLGILASVAQMERELIKERQREGIKAARAKGKKFGRPSKATPEQVKELRKSLSIAETARELEISPATVNRLQKSAL
ncbi:recombinase family protein [Vibrio coralliirubri]|uniref:recombinase family protein n=1 Tax=Vibrio coralliirubri TaxID=1516159 RepID=UPI002284EDB0|nr:recombinase family protein [Vibrio coralliirubri]MCY9865176.1 recombinase family protein [Vibrio coralliirubri]